MAKKKSFVVGDIHGNYEALKQVIQKSGIKKDKDRLIVLGDTCDGFPFVKQCFDELLTFKDLVYILGNHDLWALRWYLGKMGEYPARIWTSQGGEQTLQSYLHLGMDKQHLSLLDHAPLYYVQDNKLFTHGGIDERKSLAQQDQDTFLWDRDMLKKAIQVHNFNKDYKFQEWDQIFVGHTTTENILGIMAPIRVCNVVALDTGAGWSGKLTIMDVDTGEFWQSDKATELYPTLMARRSMRGIYE